MSIIAPAGTGEIPSTVTPTQPLATQTNPTQNPNATTSSAPPLPAAAAAHGGGPQGLHQSGTTGTIVNTVS